MIGAIVKGAGAALRWVAGDPAIAALALAAGAYGVQTYRVADLTVKLSSATSRATVAEAKVELQNAAIDNLAAIGAAKTEAAELAMAAARQTGAGHVERSKEILREKVPAPDAECAAAKALLEKFQ